MLIGLFLFPFLLIGLVLASGLRDFSGMDPVLLLRMAPFYVTSLFWFFVVRTLSQRAVRALQDEIDAIDAIEQS